MTEAMTTSRPVTNTSEFRARKALLSVRRTLILGDEEMPQDFGALFEMPCSVDGGNYQLQGWVGKMLVVAQYNENPGKATKGEKAGVADQPALRIFALHNGVEPVEIATAWKHKARATDREFFSGHTIHLSGKDRGEAKDQLTFNFTKPGEAQGTAE